MSVEAHPRPVPRPAFNRKSVAAVAVVASLLAAMALDTKVVRIGSGEHVPSDVFAPEAFGAATFPEVQAAVEKRAIDAAALSAALAANKAAATKQYGTEAGAGAVFPVRFTGTVGEGKSGLYKVAVAGLPPELTVRVQTGPAINGTDLRDATGTIAFGQFKNQIEYQNAGSALNNAMKAEVLAGVDTAGLAGKTVTVTGVFKLVNPKSWLVTPVRLTTP